MHRIPKVILTLENSRAYSRGLLRGIAKYASLHGPWFFYQELPFYLRASAESRILARLKKPLVHGIIARGTGNVQKILSRGVPTIFADIMHNTLDAHIVRTDDITIGRMGAQHLLDRGFRRFAFCGFDDMFWSRERAAGFTETVKQAGFDVCFYVLPTTG